MSDSIGSNFSHAITEGFKALGSFLSDVALFPGRLLQSGRQTLLEHPVSNTDARQQGASLLKRAVQQGEAPLPMHEVDQYVEMARQDVNADVFRDVSRDAMVRVLRNDRGRNYTLEQKMGAAIALAGADGLEPTVQKEVAGFLLGSLKDRRISFTDKHEIRKLIEDVNAGNAASRDFARVAMQELLSDSRFSQDEKIYAARILVGVEGLPEDVKVKIDKVLVSNTLQSHKFDELLSNTEIDEALASARDHINSLFENNRTSSRAAMVDLLNNAKSNYTLDQRMRAAFILASASDLDANAHTSVVRFMMGCMHNEEVPLEIRHEMREVLEDVGAFSSTRKNFAINAMVLVSDPQSGFSTNDRIRAARALVDVGGLEDSIERRINALLLPQGADPEAVDLLGNRGIEKLLNDAHKDVNASSTALRADARKAMLDMMSNAKSNYTDEQRAHAAFILAGAEQIEPKYLKAVGEYASTFMKSGDGRARRFAVHALSRIMGAAQDSQSRLDAVGRLVESRQLDEMLMAEVAGHLLGFLRDPAINENEKYEISEIIQDVNAFNMHDRQLARQAMVQMMRNEGNAFPEALSFGAAYILRTARDLDPAIKAEADVKLGGTGTTDAEDKEVLLRALARYGITEADLEALETFEDWDAASKAQFFGSLFEALINSGIPVDEKQAVWKAIFGTPLNAASIGKPVVREFVEYYKDMRLQLHRTFSEHPGTINPPGLERLTGFWHALAQIEPGLVMNFYQPLGASTVGGQENLLTRMYASLQLALDPRHPQAFRDERLQDVVQYCNDPHTPRAYAIELAAVVRSLPGQ